MEKCPTEILLQIFGLACLDDGTTGRSLSFVSRSVRAASSPARFQSLVLRGLDRMVHFTASAACLRSTGTEVNVRFLFLSIDMQVERDNLQQYLDINGFSTETAAEKDKQIVAKALNAAIDVLTQIGQTVECLKIDQRSGSVFIKLKDIPLTLPKLHTLTAAFDTSQSQPGPRLVLPSLHTAHITFSLLHEPRTLWDELANLAPNNTLRRLRMSEAAMTHGLVPLLRLQLDVPFAPNGQHEWDYGQHEGDWTAEEQREAKSRVQRLSRLREICVQLHPGKFRNGRRLTPYSARAGPLRRTALDAAESNVPCGHLQVLDGIRRQRTSEETIADWLEEIAGGDGCWGGSRSKK